MESLKELVYIVNRNVTKRINLVNASSGKTKMDELYRLVSDGQACSDDEAFAKLYRDDTSPSAYRNVKSKLRERLLNTLFFIDIQKQSHSDRQAAFFQAQKTFTAAQILLAKHARNTGIPLVEKVYKQAETYEFTDLAVSCARILRLHACTREGDQEKAEVYHQAYERYQQIDLMEARAEWCYSQLVMQYVQNKSTKKELRQLARKHYKELSAAFAEIKSFKFRMYAGLVELFQYTCVNDYQSVIELCQVQIDFFRSKNFAANTPIQICLHHQVVGYLQLGDYQRGLTVAMESQVLLEEGSYNWFKNLEYLYLLNMHAGNYPQAYAVFRQAVEHRRFELLPNHIREMWQLYRAYLHLLIDAGQLVLEGKDSQFSSFRLNRFLNEMPVYSKDKRGMNIAILIVQILFYIQKEKYDTAIDRIEAVEKYCSRYLFQEETMRSYHFIKILLSIPKAGFRRGPAMQAAADHLNDLQTISLQHANQFHKIEIIPYETLWALALQMLDADDQAAFSLNGRVAYM